VKYSRNSRQQSLLLTLLIYFLALTVAVLTFRFLPEDNSLLLNILLADMAATVTVFLFSLLFNNSSLYDPYWSIAPPVIFIFLFFGSNDKAFSIRSILVLAITLFWGIRLTLNWALTWPGLVHEDWRYVSFRMKFGKFYWPISLLAIHFFPTLIVYLCSIPAFLVFQGDNSALNLLDIIALLSGVIAVYFEWRSDYELITHRKSDRGNTPMQTGLWKLSRHPNYFGEILFWFSLYLFSLASSLNNYWIGFAPVAMLLLFLLYSIPAMEKRQLRRKAEYREILDRISMLFPLPPRQ
jgi:steroid 5-alpha reductase family enzyme